MTVTHSPKGFTGTVDEIAEARRWGLSAPPFRVASATDWAVTANVNVDRTVMINAGDAVAYGVEDTTTVQDSLTLAANDGSTPRFDAIVATWDWVAHTVAFGVIQGGAAPPQVNPSPTTVSSTQLNRIRGVRYDALLAIVQVDASAGPLSSGDVVDCRMWGGYSGFANVPDATYLSLLDTYVGDLVHSTDTDIVWNKLPNGAWGFEKWIGTDKSKQPMMSLRSLNSELVDNVSVQNTFADVVDHGQGLFTKVGNLIQCNAYGRVRIDCKVTSDCGSAGWMGIAVTFLGGGGNYLDVLESYEQRSTGYTGAGTLRQMVPSGPYQVEPGDQISLQVQQLNTASVAITINTYLSATYI